MAVHDGGRLRARAPGSLEALGKVCGLNEDEGKLVDDKGLIDTFCVPQPATGKFIEPEDAPEEWAAVLQVRDPRHRGAAHDL